MTPPANIILARIVCQDGFVEDFKATLHDHVVCITLDREKAAVLPHDYAIAVQGFLGPLGRASMLQFITKTT